MIAVCSNVFVLLLTPPAARGCVCASFVWKLLTSGWAGVAARPVMKKAAAKR